ncbi:MAG TPA: glycosyltransferase family 4 protein, partial [Clostridia bacterium]|nr:glycosyltransferase family 4 protein [Clostridia bacterium]
LELARALGAQGVETALATMGRLPTAAQRREAATVPNLELFESEYRLEWMPDPWEDVSRAGQWLLQIEERVQPDIVHLNGYCHGQLPWRAPNIIVGHSCVLSWWRAVHHTDAPADWRTYKTQVRAGLQAAQVVVAPSHAMLRALSTHYPPLRRTTVIPNGRRPPANRLPDKQPIVLTAGRLWDQAKNVEILQSIATGLPWPVYLAGDAGEQHPPGRNVQLLGVLPAEELWSWFAQASIYALPARYEPFGLSALEAGLAGCALVLGDIDSLRETWDGAALFAPPDSPEALKSVLLDLMHNPERIKALGRAAQQRAASYTPNLMARQYVQVYRRALERGSDNPTHPKGVIPCVS